MTLSLLVVTQSDRSETPRSAQTQDTRGSSSPPCGTKSFASRQSANADCSVWPIAALERRRSGARMSRLAELAIEEAARTAEQQRIGQQLHDDLGGVLTGLNACLSVLVERAARAGATPDPLLVDASQLGKIAFDTVRQVAKELRPPLLNIGLWEAIEWNVNMLLRRSNIRCELVVAPDVRSIKLGGASESVIFRVVCEALTNTERHARASRAVVSVTEQAGQILVSVVDDGVGFGAADLESLGLSGMKERAQELGGALSVKTICGGGTEVCLSVPIGGSNAT